MSIMASPVRRVLGEKDVNAGLSPRKQHPAKAAALEPLGPVSTNTTVETPSLTPADDSKKRALEEDGHKTSIEDHASLSHVNKRPKQNPVGEEDRVAEDDTSMASPAVPEVLSSRGVSTSLLPDSTALMNDHSGENLSEQDQESSQAATLADSVNEPSFAETLRLRLRVAMYKIRTDQVAAPLSRLEITTTAPSTPKAELEIRDPPEDAIRRFRKISRKAHPRPSLPSRQYPLESGPELYAPHDARLPTMGGAVMPERTRYIRSSSPACSDCEGDVQMGMDDEDRTPATPAPGPLRTRLSPSNVTVGYGDPFAVQPFLAAPQSAERDVTSSAVKGSAADSLLRLGSCM